MENSTYLVMSIIAIFLSPIIAVLISLWYQSYDSKHNEKLDLFLTLMANRKSNPPPYTSVNALNTIDVVFYKYPKVVSHWHKVYDILHQKIENINWESYNHHLLEMLSEMARVLGYPNLKQTDIDKFYVPDIYGKRFEISQKLQEELLRVLENTAHFVLHQKDIKSISLKDKDQNSEQK